MNPDGVHGLCRGAPGGSPGYWVTVGRSASLVHWGPAGRVSLTRPPSEGSVYPENDRNSLSWASAPGLHTVWDQRCDEGHSPGSRTTDPELTKAALTQRHTTTHPETFHTKQTLCTHKDTQWDTHMHMQLLTITSTHFPYVHGQHLPNKTDNITHACLPHAGCTSPSLPTCSPWNSTIQAQSQTEWNLNCSSNFFSRAMSNLINLFICKMGLIIWVGLLWGFNGVKHLKDSILGTLPVVVYSLSWVQLFATPWTVATPQAPLSRGCPRQEYWSGLPFLAPRDLPHPGTNPHLLHWQADFFYHWATWEDYGTPNIP